MAKEFINNPDKAQTLNKLLKKYNSYSPEYEENMVDKVISNLQESLFKADVNRIAFDLKNLSRAIVKELETNTENLNHASATSMTQFDLLKLSDASNELYDLKQGIRDLRKDAYASVLYDTLLNSNFYKKLLGEDITLTEKTPELEQNSSKGIGYRPPIPGMPS